MKRILGWIVSTLAHCNNCNWSCETNDRRTQQKAYSHAKNNGHYVVVSYEKVFHYNFKKVRKGFKTDIGD